ncbi:Guanine nucleotide exchange factor MSS4 [Aphelenchoides besseyi]|nr:Guanine nucleotide exchange factor MSS4 [Aphelenchoides besseyi]KAI6228088.1 Guanine nucleotide exchange factor MSS4 [Aphelenchoides besseyi]
MFFSIAGKTINDKCTGVNEPVNQADLLNAKGKNKRSIVCRRCQSLIFPANVVVLSKLERELKIMSLNGSASLGKEKTTLWWQTDNDLDFDTIGWQTIDGVKTLMCGDCEFGPVGLREVGAQKSTFLVAVERVKYV